MLDDYGAAIPNFPAGAVTFRLLFPQTPSSLCPIGGPKTKSAAASNDMVFWRRGGQRTDLTEPTLISIATVSLAECAQDARETNASGSRSTCGPLSATAIASVATMDSGVVIS